MCMFDLKLGNELVSCGNELLVHGHNINIFFPTSCLEFSINPPVKELCHNCDYIKICILLYYIACKKQ